MCNSFLFYAVKINFALEVFFLPNVPPNETVEKAYFSDEAHED